MLDASGIKLSDESIRVLHERTEGWAAGLRLAALSLARHPEPEKFVAEFSGSEHMVADYLLAEVLERQPETVRRLLLRTSILDRVNGALADVLVGEPGSEAILQELEDDNAFVVSIDASRSWFRYHHLLADLLQLELRKRAPAELRALHSTAARWFSEHGFPLEAVRHAQAAEDWTLAAWLLSESWFGLYLDRPERDCIRVPVGLPAGRRRRGSGTHGAHGRQGAESWLAGAGRPVPHARDGEG